MGNGNYVRRGDQVININDDDEDLEDNEEEDEADDMNDDDEYICKDPNQELGTVEVDYFDIVPEEYKEELRRCGTSVSCLDEEKGIAIVFGGWKFPNPGKRLNDIVIIGGLNDGHVHYRRIIDNHDQFIPLPRNLHKTIIIQRNNIYRIYLYAGFGGRSCIDDFCYFDLTLTENDFHASNWIVVDRTNKKWPTERAGYTLDHCGTKFYMFGGVKNYSGATNELWAFDYLREEWELVETFGDHKPLARMYHSSAVIGESIVIMGGSNSFNGAKFFSDIWILHLSRDKKHYWQKINYEPPSQVPFAFHSMSCVGTQLVVFGGESPHLSKNELNEPYLVDLTYLDSVRFKKIIGRKEDEENDEGVDEGLGGSTAFEPSLPSSLGSLEGVEPNGKKEVVKKIHLGQCYYWMPSLFMKGNLLTFFGSFDWNTFVHVDGAIKKFVFKKTVPSLKEICVRNAKRLHGSNLESLSKILPVELFKLVVNYYPSTPCLSKKLL